MIGKIIILVVCLILSALFSGTEIVYSMVNKHKLEREANAGNKRSQKALNITNDYSSTITTLLIGNNLVNILLTSVSTVLALDLAIENNFDANLATTLMTVIITVTLLIFGEILPKTLFQNYSYSLSKLLIPYVTLFKIIFYPFVITLSKLTNKIASKFDKGDETPQDEAENLAKDELISIVEDLEENGYIDTDDQELIESAIDFVDTVAWQIMIPRVDVVAYDIEDGLEEMINDSRFFENSRVPIYRDSIDHVVGILDTTKVLKLTLNKLPVNINDCLYEPLYVHKTMPIASVLKELKETHKHLAIVLDEWGGTYGILTIEDILEELFGNIWDETDVVEIEYEKIDDSSYIVDGDMNINDFFDLVDFDDRDFESDYSTIGGWCAEELDKVPEQGDKFDYENLSIEVLNVDERRVEKVKVIINEIEVEEE